MRETTIFSMLAWLLVLVGCGSPEEAKRDTRAVPAEIELKIPDEAISEEFWEGVGVRVLLWRPVGGSTEFELPLTGGEGAAVDLSIGGTLVFEGRSAGGTVLVHGTATIAPWSAASGQRKVILISLRRRG